MRISCLTAMISIKMSASLLQLLGESLFMMDIIPPLDPLGRTPQEHSTPKQVTKLVPHLLVSLAFKNYMEFILSHALSTAHTHPNISWHSSTTPSHSFNIQIVRAKHELGDGNNTLTSVNIVSKVPSVPSLMHYVWMGRTTSQYHKAVISDNALPRHNFPGRAIEVSDSFSLIQYSAFKRTRIMHHCL